jgi:hypothetical protein
MQHNSVMGTAVVTETIEVRNTVLNGIMLRTWLNNADCISDLRLTPMQARTLAANLLHAAQCDDGQQVSFFWHASGCESVAQANGQCQCNGRPVAA